MNTLNLGSDEIPEKKKKSSTRNLKIALGLAAVILVPTIGSTLAGQINIATATVEFGQGVAATVACQSDDENPNTDDSLKIIPESELVLGPSVSYFILSFVTIANINPSCVGKTFIVKLKGMAGDSLVFGGENSVPDDACVINWAGDFTTYSGACQYEPSGVGEFVFSPLVEVEAANVYGITIESIETLAD